MRRAAAHRRLEMQHAVVRGDDGMAEARRDRKVRSAEALREDPGRTEAAASLLVIGQVQLDGARQPLRDAFQRQQREGIGGEIRRSEEHTSELQSLMRISYAVFCLK